MSSHTRASASSVQASSSSSRPKKNPPRPPNSFICFRSSKQWREVERGIKGRKAKGAASGKAWRNLPPEDRAFYIEMAEAKKREHNLLYPNYEYKPRRRARKKKSPKRDEHARTTEAALDVGNPGPSTSSEYPSMTIDDSNNEVAVDAAGEEESDVPFVDPLLSASDKQSFGYSFYNPTSTSFTVQPATDFQGQFLAFMDQFPSSY
ncbi:hypothetical protein ACEPAF_6242 [Sanghuangporus sanghuang]|uniref:HMG box domain-containing protein n=1 Tax=Sanghuangporus baumii TaxID=108892 RepID=A0A9Q5I0S2_SANBA|nr:hypothetical protein A7U60_g3267 [Sanghuangporus baumii]